VTAPQRQAYLTVREVAALPRCEHKFVRRAIDAGDLRAFMVAGKLLVRDDDARTWIESRPVKRGTRAPTTAHLRARSGPGSVAKLREMEREATGTESN
jgi:excisionase family DNA binding protein